MEVKHTLPENAGRGGIGTPDQFRAYLEGYEKAGVDQLIFVQQQTMRKDQIQFLRLIQTCARLNKLKLEIVIKNPLLRGFFALSKA